MKCPYCEAIEKKLLDAYERIYHLEDQVVLLEDTILGTMSMQHFHAATEILAKREKAKAGI